ncbi:4-diphosphocytidyl-2-C-methyl-D-erythritol kinase [Lactococcus hodotermopsidis]|uniref:4-diphosphocytidyl-2-C-methyl-D-erythritol kinase n=1 Tax=Pseudolactococcus hodotermopsidis TaxID=2709157 RepID=A0A6A0BDM3_9LACT|nr:4-(cytidine 5'-diphospho)-2-C-methyl-D-erythritol kinase [Lactococcus hodotermopsidis]GFH42461.1 4-diphosphocytidyl-2-C-methyl-D-erythritol kinase [Lactococcus hodotermopsidis]
MEITEKAPAKINLGLDILGKRDDGYHELDMIMASVDLADRITVREIADKDVIRLQSNSSFVPLNKKNHAYKAAVLLKRTFHITTGVDIYIDKKTPISAGLAGGSSDAAATLRALNKLWQLKLTLPELAKLGEQIGSDVPYCVYGETARVTGRGEHVRPIENHKKFWVILVKPEFGVSTPDIFRRVNLAQIKHPDVDALEHAVVNSNFDVLLENLGNALEAVTTEKYPFISKIKQRLLDSGADGVLMSGSGPTVFALCQQEKKAQRICDSIKGFCDEVYLVRML